MDVFYCLCLDFSFVSSFCSVSFPGSRRERRGRLSGGPVRLRFSCIFPCKSIPGKLSGGHVRPKLSGDNFPRGGCTPHEEEGGGTEFSGKPDFGTQNEGSGNWD